MFEVILVLANVSSLFFGFVLKLPQIWALYGKKDISGMSWASIFLELASYSIVMCYNISNDFPIKNFAEYPVLVLQDLILIGMMLTYSKKFGMGFFAFVGAYNAIIYAVSTNMTPSFIITFLMLAVTLQLYFVVITYLFRAFNLTRWIGRTNNTDKACCTPLTAMSKTAQLRAMWSTRNARSVSVLTWAIATYSCICRLLTTFATTADIPLMTNFTVALVLNAGITISAIYLQRNDKTA